MDGKLKENLENAFEDADDALTKGRVGAAAEDAISDLSGSEADEAVGKRRGPIKSVANGATSVVSVIWSTPWRVLMSLHASCAI